MERTLENLSDVELKAVAYDTLAQLQLFQQNIQVINAELAKRAQARQQNQVLTPEIVPPGEAGNFQTT
jgi:hypothetical protein